MEFFTEGQRRTLRAGGVVDVGGVLVERMAGGWRCSALVTGGGFDDPGHPFFERRAYLWHDLADVLPLFRAHLVERGLLVDGGRA